MHTHTHTHTHTPQQHPSKIWRAERVYITRNTHTVHLAKQTLSLSLSLTHTHTHTHSIARSTLPFTTKINALLSLVSFLNKALLSGLIYNQAETQKAAQTTNFLWVSPQLSKQALKNLSSNKRRQKERTYHSSIIHSAIPKTAVCEHIFTRWLRLNTGNGGEKQTQSAVEGGKKKKAKKGLKPSSQKSDSRHYLPWKMTHQSSGRSSFIIVHVCSSHSSFHQVLSVSQITLYASSFCVSFIL